MSSAYFSQSIEIMKKQALSNQKAVSDACLDAMSSLVEGLLPGEDEVDTKRSESK